MHMYKLLRVETSIVMLSGSIYTIWQFIVFVVLL